MDNNLDYMIIGYVIGLAIMALIIGSIWWRYRSLQADEATLQQLEAEVKAENAAPAAKTAYPKAAEKTTNDVAEAV